MLTIIGTGKMAEAIIKGLIKRKEKILVVGRDEKRLQQLFSTYPLITEHLDNFNIEGDNIILAIKPYALQEVAKKLKGKASTLISILAGTSLQDLKVIPAWHYIRAMPNIAAAQGASITAITGDKEAKELAITLFEAIGKAVWVESEKELDIATAIAGSGPAFLALVEEAITDGGVACGLSRENAHIFAKGLFASYASLANMHPAVIKESVMSPAGTTAAGIEELEKDGIRGAFIQAVKKAFSKTQK